MRFLLSLLLCLCATATYAVVAPGDEREHPVLSDCEVTGTAHVPRPVMDNLGKNIGVAMKPGFLLAGIQSVDGGHCVIADDVAADAVMIVCGNDKYTLLVYQIDQTKPFAEIPDFLIVLDEKSESDDK